MSEVWQTIPGYDYRYSVSSMGRVRRNEQTTTCGKVIKEMPIKLVFKSASIYASLTRNGQCVKTTVLRLMAMAFLGLDEDEKGVTAIPADGDGYNTELTNVLIRKASTYYTSKGYKFVGTIGENRRYMITEDGKVFDFKAGKGVKSELVRGIEKVKIAGESRLVPVEELVMKVYDKYRYKSIKARQKKYYGVYKNSTSGRWYAQPYNLNGGKVYIGTFTEKEDARKATRAYIDHGLIEFDGEDFYCIPDFDGRYFMSRTHRVINREREFIPRRTEEDGNLYMRLSKNGKVQRFYSEDLVFSTFGDKLERRPKTSKYKGVSRRVLKSGVRWAAIKNVDDKTLYLGNFDTEEEARDRRLLYDKTGA